MLILAKIRKEKKLQLEIKPKYFKYLPNDNIDKLEIDLLGCETSLNWYESYKNCHIFHNTIFSQSNFLWILYHGTVKKAYYPVIFVNTILFEYSNV